MSNILDPDQTRNVVGLDPASNFFQRLSADDKNVTSSNELRGGEIVLLNYFPCFLSKYALWVLKAVSFRRFDQLTIYFYEVLRRKRWGKVTILLLIDKPLWFTEWINHYPRNSGVAGLIQGFSRLSGETFSFGPVSI